MSIGVIMSNSVTPWRHKISVICIFGVAVICVFIFQTVISTQTVEILSIKSNCCLSKWRWSDWLLNAAPSSSYLPLASPLGGAETRGRGRWGATLGKQKSPHVCVKLWCSSDTLPLEPCYWLIQYLREGLLGKHNYSRCFLYSYESLQSEVLLQVTLSFFIQTFSYFPQRAFWLVCQSLGPFLRLFLRPFTDASTDHRLYI